MNIKDFIKAGVLRRGVISEGTIDIGDNINMKFVCNLKDNNNYLRLIYCISIGDYNADVNYKIDIDSIPSNLGKGEILYFNCPIVIIRCRVLYIVYGSYHFKSRDAYKNRIYYKTQLSSKLERPNDSYWQIERELEAMDLKHHKPYYNGS